jgi:hypothetical protein
MGTRRKAKNDLKIEQGKRRDAYFAQLRRAAQPKASTPAAEKTPQPASS